MSEVGNQPQLTQTPMVATPPPTSGPSTVAGGRPTTQEKPGTGEPPTGDEENDWKYTGPSGEITYPDGFRMGMDERGTWYLEDPSGTRATWDEVTAEWAEYKPDSNEPWKGLGKDWGKGHQLPR